MKESSKLPLFDLRKLNASLPVPSVPEITTEILVMGARNDFIVVSEPPLSSLPPQEIYNLTNPSTDLPASMVVHLLDCFTFLYNVHKKQFVSLLVNLFMF